MLSVMHGVLSRMRFTCPKRMHGVQSVTTVFTLDVIVTPSIAVKSLVTVERVQGSP